MQLVQLMQYVKIESFSIVLSNKVLNVSISSNNVRAYQSLGFDTTSFNEDDESFSYGIRKPIRMVQYGDSHTWGKYCKIFIEVDFYEKEQVKKNVDGSFRSSLIDFLQTDFTGISIYSMNADILTEIFFIIKPISQCR
jgi:hypothetical protein